VCRAKKQAADVLCVRQGVADEVGVRFISVSLPEKDCKKCADARKQAADVLCVRQGAADEADVRLLLSFIYTV